MISSPLILHTTGDVHTPPPKCTLQGRREHVSPNFSRTRETCLRLVSPSFSCSNETSNKAPPARHSANSGGASLLLLDLYILVLQRIILVFNARVAAVASFLVFNELEPPSSIMHLENG